ncbi:nitroreductase family protein [Gemella sanguinis]
MRDFFDVIRNRRSVKYYDESIKISRKEILEMLNEANITPSSCNFQPWRYIVVDTPEGKEKLGEANYNKVQNDTSSAMIILLGDLDYFEKFEEIYGAAVDEGHMTEDVKEKFKISLEGMIEATSHETKRESVYFDCGLWAMQFTNIVHAKGYDSNIIGGFDREKVSELFELDESLIPIMLIAIGKKDKDARPTTRIPAENLVTFK